MKTLLIFFLFELFTNGVFSVDAGEVKSVSVMEGDSVTLHTNFTKMDRNDVMEWKFGSTRLAKIDRETNSTSSSYSKNFENRLDINNQTGDLTIKKIRAGDSGSYVMTVTGNNDLTKRFQIDIVNDSASDGVMLVSVMNRDSVILHTGVTDIQPDDVIEWRYGPKRSRIAAVNKTLPYIYVGGIKDRLHLNHQKGDLIIRHIRNDTSGLYEVQITRSSKSYTITKRFNVTIGDQLNRMSIKEGQPVNLFSGIVKPHTDDVILWWFERGDSPIAKIDRKSGIFSTFDNVLDGRFRGRLQLDHQTGNLTITNTKKEDSGLYHVDSSSSTYTLFTRYSLTICGPDQFSAPSLAVIFGLVFLVILAVTGVVYYRRKLLQMRNVMGQQMELERINLDGQQQ